MLSQGALNAILAHQAAGTFDNLDVNKTGVAPVQRSGTESTVSSGFSLNGGDVPYDLQDAGPQADVFDIIQNVNERYAASNTAVKEATSFNGYDLTKSGLVGGQMAYSPEMAARLGVDERIDYGLGDTYYNSSDAIRDIEAELKRSGIETAEDLKVGVKGSHNDLYPNLGIGNRLYQTTYNPIGGRSRDVVFQDDARKQDAGALIGVEKGKKDLFANPIFDIVAAALAPYTAGLSVAALGGAKAATGTTLHKDDAVNIATSLAAPYLPGGGEAATITDAVKAGGREAIEQYKDDKEEDRQVVWQPPNISDILGDAQVQIPDYSVIDDDGGGGGGTDKASEEAAAAAAAAKQQEAPTADGGLEEVFDGIPDPVEKPSHDWPDANYEFEKDPDYTTEPTHGGNIVITHTESGATRTVGDPGRDMRDETTTREDEDPPFEAPTDNLPEGYQWVEGEDGEPVLKKTEPEKPEETSIVGDIFGIDLSEIIFGSVAGVTESTAEVEAEGESDTGESETTGEGETGDQPDGTDPEGDAEVPSDGTGGTEPDVGDGPDPGPGDGPGDGPGEDGKDGPDIGEPEEDILNSLFGGSESSDLFDYTQIAGVRPYTPDLMDYVAALKGRR